MADPELNRAYLSLGSNIDAERNLPAAVRLLARYGRILAVSTVWESEPVGRTDQPKFLNAAVLLETALAAERLRLEAIEEIERALGRIRDGNDKNAPRPIDIDIILFNRDVLRIGHRPVPDPTLLDRGFVGIPVCELDPGYVHPQTGQTLAEIAGNFETERTGMTARPDVILLASSIAIVLEKVSGTVFLRES